MKHFLILISLFLTFNLSAQQWDKLDFENNIVMALAVSPSNNSVIYASINTCSMNSNYLLVKSIDDGNSWSEVEVNQENFTYALGITIDPQFSDTVYLSNYHSLLKTTDGGETWNNITPGSADVSVLLLEVDPQDYEVLYCIAEHYLYKSSDGGDSWVTLFNNASVKTFARHPLNSEILFLGLNSHVNSNFLFKSIDGGINWEEIPTSFILGGKTSDIVVTEQDSIYINIFIQSGEIRAKVYKSDINEVNFVQVGEDIPGMHTSLLLDNEGNQLYSYGRTVKKLNEELNQWDTWYDNSPIYPNGIILTDDAVWIGSIHGLLKMDSMEDDPKLVFLGIDAVNWVVDLVIDDRIPGVMYLSTTTTRLFKSCDYGNSWFPISNNLISGSFAYSNLEISPHDPNLLYSSGLYRSENGGETWNAPEIQVDKLAIAFPSSNPDNVVVGNADGIYISTDSGQEWQQTNIVNTYINSIATYPLHPDTLFASSFLYPGGIFKSSDGGFSWEEHNMMFERVKQIMFDRFNPNIAYLITEAEFYISFDHGEIWTLVNNGLDATNERLFQPPHYQGHLLLKSSIGLLLSEDGGFVWHQLSLNDQIPYVHEISDVAFDTENNLIYCTVNFNGIYYKDYQSCLVGIEENELNINNSTLEISNYPNPFNPSTVISFQMSEFSNQSAEIEIYNLRGQKIKQFSDLRDQRSVTWNGSDQNNNPVSSGVYLYKLKVDGKTEAVKKCMLLK